MALVSFALTQVVAQSLKGNEKERSLLHSFLCSELGLGLALIATLNPSLSAFLSLAVVPPALLFLAPFKRSSLLWFIQQSVICLIQPPTLLLLIYGIQFAGSKVDDLRFEFQVFGAWLWPLFLWLSSVAMGAQILVGL